MMLNMMIIDRLGAWVPRLADCIPFISSGYADWCGRFVIVHAPVAVSQLRGRGTSGIEWFRWTERGSELIKADRAYWKNRGNR